MKGIICDRCKTPKSRGDACWVKFQSSFFLFAHMQQSRKFDLCNACAQAVTLFAKGETKRYTNDPLFEGDDDADREAK